MKNSKWLLLSVLLAIVCIAVPVIASQISQTKDTDPLEPNKYHVGDTIHYVMTIGNPAENTATNYLSEIYDLDPNGDIIYFVEDGVDPPLVQEPNDSNMFYYDYMVAEDDLQFYIGKMRVINQLHSSGIDSLEDIIDAITQKNSVILQPCIDVNKTVEPTISKAGDDVVYTIEICNCGDANLTVTDLFDDVLGEIDFIDCNYLVGGVYNGQGNIQPGQCCTLVLEPYTIQETDPDPLINTVCVTAVDEIGGAAGEVNDCDTAMVDLVHPGLMVEKGCPDYSKVGDIVDYNVVITNTGDIPIEILEVDDSLAGPQTDCVGQVLPLMGTCELSYTYQVQEGDNDPLINTVTVRAQVVGLPNIIEETTGCQTELVEPDLTVSKECLTDPVTGDTAQFRITITNTGDIPLIITSDEPELAGPLELVIGQPIVLDVDRPVDGAMEVSNTINVQAILPEEYGLDNVLNRSASDTCPVEVPGEGCRLTGGGVDEEYSNDGCSSASPENDRVQFGGQAGAHTALPPQPSGEWTHHQQRGPSGRFTFHAGTSSAPAGTEIIEIRCSDPGGCKPSGDPPSPAKQVDFDGVGTFKNFGRRASKPTWPDASVAVNAKCSSKGGKFRFDGTYHYFEVNADDCGEPGNKKLDAASDPRTCPPDGFGEKGDVELADCDCHDFYRITIYNGVDAADVTFLSDGSIDLSTLNMTDVIYEFYGYLDGGNLQIHYLTGFDSP